MVHTHKTLKKEENRSVTEWINKILQYSTGNYIQYPVINHNGKEYEKEYIYIYIHVLYNCIGVQQKLM